MLNIRPMQAQDADTVRQIDRLAFLSFQKKQNPNGPFTTRTRANILAGRMAFPPGCLVAEQDGEMAAYVFSRVWGEVGWVGVFGVHPEQQRSQVGKQLLGEAIGVLKGAGCTTIGLETMPDSTYNIGLYTRRGFRPLTLTLLLEKPVGPRPAGAYRLLSPDDERGLQQVTAISRAAWPEQDLRLEAENALTHAWGEVLLLSDAAETGPWAAAILRVIHRREGDAGEPLPNEVCEVSALSSLPQARSCLPEALHCLEDYAAGRGFKHLRLPMNSADWSSLQVLLAEGYRVVHTSLRLVLRGDYHAQPGIEFSRWAM